MQQSENEEFLYFEQQLKQIHLPSNGISVLSSRLIEKIKITFDAADYKSTIRFADLFITYLQPNDPFDSVASLYIEVLGIRAKCNHFLGHYTNCVKDLVQQTKLYQEMLDECYWEFEIQFLQEMIEFCFTEIHRNRAAAHIYADAAGNSLKCLYQTDDVLYLRNYIKLAMRIIDHYIRNKYFQLARYHQEIIIEKLNIVNPEVMTDVYEYIGISFRNLGEIFGGVGQTRLALDYTTIALNFYNSLSLHEPNLFKLDMAFLNRNLGVWYFELKDHQLALDSTRKAIQLFQESSEEISYDRNIGMASSFYNLGFWLYRMNQFMESKDATIKSVRIYARLPDQSLKRHTSELAQSLILLAKIHSQAKDQQAAFEFSQEALNLLLKCASKGNHLRAVDLTNAYLCLSDRHAEMNEHQQALDAAQEAVLLFQRLDENEKNYYIFEHFKVYYSLGIRLAALNHHHEALDALERALKLLQKDTATDPEFKLRDLAATHLSMGNQYAELGNHQLAFDGVQQAVAILCELAEENPIVYACDLAKALDALALRHRALNNDLLAYEAQTEAFKRRIAMTKMKSDWSGLDLLSSFDNLIITVAEMMILGAESDDQSQHMLGFLEGKAIELTQMMMELYRFLAEENMKSDLQDWARSLNNFAFLFNALGLRHSNTGFQYLALDHALESVRLHLQMCDQEPDSYQPDVVLALNTLGSILWNLSRHQEALEAWLQAISLRGQTCVAHLACEGVQGFERIAQYLKMHPQINLPELQESMTTAVEAVTSNLMLIQRHTPDSFSRYQNITQELLRLLVEYHMTNQLLEFLNVLHQGAFWFILQTQTEPPQGVSPEAWKKLKQKTHDLQLGEAPKIEAIQRKLNEDPQAFRSARTEILSKTEQRNDEHLRQLAFEVSRLEHACGIQNQVLDAEAILEHLRVSGEGAVMFFTLHEHLHALTVHPDKQTSDLLHTICSVNEMQQLTEEFSALLEQKAGFSEKAAAFYQQHNHIWTMFDPIWYALNGIQTIHVLLDETTFNLPLHAFRQTNGRFVAQDFQLVYTSSFSALQFISRYARHPQVVFTAVGMKNQVDSFPDPLTIEEIKFPTSSEDFDNRFQSTQEVLEIFSTQLSGETELDLHLAVHGVFDAETPKNSRFNWNSNVGTTLHDFYGSGISFRQVRTAVLLACQSGARPQEYALSLSGTLQALGAQNVVSSVVRLPEDVAERFLEVYYGEMYDQHWQHPRKLFFETLKVLVGKGDLKDVRCWAPFMYSGV